MSFTFDGSGDGDGFATHSGDGEGSGYTAGNAINFGHGSTDLYEFLKGDGYGHGLATMPADFRHLLDGFGGGNGYGSDEAT